MLGHNWDVLEPRNYDESDRIVNEICDTTTNLSGKDVSLMRGFERVMLYEIAAGLHQKPETQGFTLEFGAWAGVSSIIITEGALRKNDRYPTVVSVDPYLFDRKDELTEKYVESRMLHQKYRDGYIFPYLMRVMWTDLNFMKIWNHPTRMVFIDSSHHYEHTQQEIQACLPILTEDSWLVFHDYREMYGVVRAVDEFVESQDRWEIKPYQLSNLVKNSENSLVGIHMIRKIQDY